MLVACFGELLLLQLARLSSLEQSLHRQHWIRSLVLILVLIIEIAIILRLILLLLYNLLSDRVQLRPMTRSLSLFQLRSLLNPFLLMLFLSLLHTLNNLVGRCTEPLLLCKCLFIAIVGLLSYLFRQVIKRFLLFFLYLADSFVQWLLVDDFLVSFECLGLACGILTSFLLCMLLIQVFLTLTRVFFPFLGLRVGLCFL